MLCWNRQGPDLFMSIIVFSCVVLVIFLEKQIKMLKKNVEEEFVIQTYWDDKTFSFWNQYTSK